MDISTIIIIMVVVGVLGAIGSIVFWIGVALLGVKAVQNYQREMDAMMSQYSANISNLKQTYGNDIPPAAQQQLFTQYLQAKNQMSHFDRLSQERQDLFKSSMLSQASSAGIDVSGW